MGKLGQEKTAFRRLDVGLYSSYADLRRSLFTHLIDGPAWELLMVVPLICTSIK